MDDVLAKTLKNNLEMSKTSAQKMKAMTMAMIALVDCQRKTSERVKMLIKKNEEEKHKKEGAKWAASLIYTILTLCGSSAGVIACKLFNLF